MYVCHSYDSWRFTPLIQSHVHPISLVGVNDATVQYHLIQDDVSFLQVEPAWNSNFCAAPNLPNLKVVAPHLASDPVPWGHLKNDSNPQTC